MTAGGVVSLLLLMLVFGTCRQSLASGMLLIRYNTSPSMYTINFLQFKSVCQIWTSNFGYIGLSYYYGGVATSMITWVVAQKAALRFNCWLTHVKSCGAAPCAVQ